MEKGLGQREGQHGRKKIRYEAITLIVQTGNVGPRWRQRGIAGLETKLIRFANGLVSFIHSFSTF